MTAVIRTSQNRSNWLMARDFWSKTVIHQQMRHATKCSRILTMTRESTEVLEIFWRRASTPAR